MNFRFRPLVTWPRAITQDRRNATFRADFNDTISLLDYEIGKLDGENTIVQIAIGECDFRRDGMPKVNSLPSMPGVVVSFDSRFGPLSYACDTFLLWRDNLRAIAKTLESLRAVERYGASSNGEQYRGWTAIPSKGADNGFASPEDAAAYILKASGLIGNTASLLTSPYTLNTVYREAAKYLHPDRGGSTEAFQKLQQAKEMIENAA